MKTKVIALLVLSIVQAVFSDIEAPYRLIQGSFSPLETARKGEARLDLQGETIKNITTAKSITVEISAGGVGYSYVNFSYEVPPEEGGYFEALILTAETDFVVHTSNYRPLEIYGAVFQYLAGYNTSNISRTDQFSVVLDREVFACEGESRWYYGNGSREVKGGYPNNYFDIVLVIPEGVAGDGSYSCSTAVNDVRARYVGSLPRLMDDGDKIGLQQLYETLDYTTIPVNITGNYTVLDIVSYEGGVQWFNGTGVWNVVGGGAGFDYLAFDYTHDAYTYGIVEYNFVIKTPWVP